MRHISGDGSSVEENVAPHNLSEVQQLRFVEFQDENYKGDEDKQIFSEDSEPNQEESFGPPLLDDMDSEDDN